MQTRTRTDLKSNATITHPVFSTADNSSGSYLLMQRAVPPQPRGGCYAR